MFRFKGKVRIIALLALLCLVLSGCSQLTDSLGIDMPTLKMPEITLPKMELPDMGDFLGQDEDETPSVAPTMPVEVPQMEQGKMPQCVGLSAEAAIQALTKAGCVASILYEHSTDTAVGYVISQSVPANTVLVADTTVTIVVSQGPAQTPACTQKVVVTALSGSSYGKLALFNWENGEWIQVFSCDATVGKNGISSNYGEGKKRTPAGEFKLGVALSKSDINNSTWPFHKVTKDTCIVDDPASAYYNTIRSIASLPSGVSYDPIGKTLSNTSNVLIFIEHNGDGYSSADVVPGKGSVITICGKTTTLKATAGCVDISAANMTKLIKQLDYSRNPVIAISAT